MTESIEPEPRVIMEGALVFGTPVAYIAIWAAIIAVTGAIPFSFIIGGAGSFPIALGLLGTTAAAIGPISGTIAVLIGRLINVFLTPWTASNPLGPFYDSLGTLGCGLLLQKDFRIRLIGYLMGLGGYLFYSLSFLIIGTDISRLFTLDVFIPGSVVAVPALIMGILGLTPYLRKFLESENLLHFIIGIIIISYFPFSIQHMIGGGIFVIQNVFPLDAAIFVAIYFTWWERLSLAAIGIVLGFAILIALRKVELKKPTNAVY